jgi:hypothetical protein
MASASGTITMTNIERVAPDGTGTLDVSVSVSNLSEDSTIDGKGLRCYPALWNAHEHLDFNLFPHMGSPPYNSAYDWGLEITEHKRSPLIDRVMRVPDRVRYFWGALKNILSATPFVLHHGETPRFLFKKYFPITVVPEHSSPHSLRFEKHLKEKFSDGQLRTIHVAEGTDREAHGELRRLNEMGYLDDRTGIVHGVGLRQSDISLLEETGSPLIWCPSSNEFLFQKHAPIGLIQRAGIPVMLGTDSTLTGSNGLLEELHIAAAQLDDPQFLFDSAVQTLRAWTYNALPEIPESLFVVKSKSGDPFKDFVSLERADILMLVHGDQLLVVDDSVDIPRPTIRTCLTVDGAKKHVAGEWAPYIHTIVNALGEEFTPGISVC